MKPSMQWSIRVGLVAAFAFSLSGCSEYLDRRDTLRRSSGEAVQNNAIVHTIDPWPRHAFIVPRTTSGERTQRAVERYRSPGSGPAAGQAPPLAVRNGDVVQPRLF